MTSYKYPSDGAGGGTGDVEGPAGATDSAIALYDGGTGRLLKNSVVTVNVSGNILTAGTVTCSGINISALTASRAVVSDGSKSLISSATTATEIGFVNGVTSAIQTQLNAKQATGNYITALTGDVVAAGPNSVTATIQSNIITNSMVNSSAAIAVNKLAALTVSRALVSDGSGFISAAITTATELGFVNGVTSAIQTQIAANQLRSVLTAKGDLYAATASNTVARLAVGTNGFLLQANSLASTGLQYVTPDNASSAVVNLELAASVAASALTIALKTSAGTDPSATDPIFIAFGNATLTAGAYEIVSLVAALSLVVSSGSTLGQSNAETCDVYFYAINSAGVIKAGVSRVMLDETVLHTSVAEGGAGAADSAVTLYSDAIYTNVRLRCVGKLINAQATAGTWATAPSNISLLPLPQAFVGCSYTRISQSVVTDATIAFDTKVYDSHNAMSSGLYTVPISGKFDFKFRAETLNVTPSVGNYFSGSMVQSGSVSLTRFSDFDFAQSTTNREFTTSGSYIFNCVKGDVLKVQFNESLPTVNLSAFSGANYVTITKVD